MMRRLLDLGQCIGGVVLPEFTRYCLSRAIRRSCLRTAITSPWWPDFGRRNFFCPRISTPYHGISRFNRPVFQVCRAQGRVRLILTRRETPCSTCFLVCRFFLKKAENAPPKRK